MEGSTGHHNSRCKVADDGKDEGAAFLGSANTTTICFHRSILHSTDGCQQAKPPMSKMSLFYCR